MKKKREWGTLLLVEFCAHGHETHMRPSVYTETYNKVFKICLYWCWSEWDHPSAGAADLNPGVSSSSPSETGHWIKSLLLTVTPVGRPLQHHFLWGAENEFYNVQVQSLKTLPPPGWIHLHVNWLDAGIKPPTDGFSLNTSHCSYWQTHSKATERGQMDRWGDPVAESMTAYEGAGCRQRDKSISGDDR